jgi:hypothetical protein
MQHQSTQNPSKAQAFPVIFIAAKFNRTSCTAIRREGRCLEKNYQLCFEINILGVLLETLKNLNNSDC